MFHRIAAGQAVNGARSLALALLASLGGCAQGAPPASSAAAPFDLPSTVADAFARAHLAEARGDRAALAAALGVIDRSGAKPAADWSGEDPVQRWRALAPDTAPPLRGSPLGPGYRCGALPAGRSDSFEQVFLSGQRAKIALSSPGNAPLTLRVVDANQRAVCATGNAQRACNWIPVFTQRYRIEVTNRGANRADYFLVVQ